MSTLLPPNATPQERAMEATAMAAGRVATAGGVVSVGTPDVTSAGVDAVRGVWNADTCPAGMLPWLAWALGVDEWDPLWPTETKRDVIKSAVAVQQRKGTIGSIKRVLAAAGYGDAQVIEGDGTVFYNGLQSYNGFVTHGDPLRWASYRVIVGAVITFAEGSRVRRLLEATAPARCHLLEIRIPTTAQYNGAQNYDGQYSYGAY